LARVGKLINRQKRPISDVRVITLKFFLIFDIC
jgi:hypothetical protein